MYKLLSICLLSISFASQAFSAPIDHWVKANKFWDEANYSSAKSEFDLCINGLEDPTMHPHYFYNRGTMLHQAGDYGNAVKDLTIAIDNPHLSNTDRAMALFYRGAAKHEMGNLEGLLSDKKEFDKINPYKLIYERTDEHLIIRNIPSCKCLQSLLDDVFTITGRCDDPKEIQKFDGVWIFKKKSVDAIDCGCGCGGANKKWTIISRNAAGERSFCDSTCQIVAVSWQVFCAKKLKGPCAVAAVVVIADLEEQCHMCCESGKFYEVCVKPYEVALKNKIKEYVEAVYNGVMCAFDW